MIFTEQPTIFLPAYHLCCKKTRPGGCTLNRPKPAEGTRQMTNTICNVVNCRKAAGTKNLCTAHYKRFMRHGDPEGGGINRSAARTFLDGIHFMQLEDCIIWPFSKAQNGYGRIKIDGGTQYVHRIVCTSTHGKPPTTRHHAAHSCGNGHIGCVNWRHLGWKTPSENAADKIVHGTDNRGTKHSSAKLTETQVKEIRALSGVISQTVLGVKYGISCAHVSGIQTRKYWPHL